MKREYAFLSCMVPTNQQEMVYKNSKNNMQDAANALEWHIYNGLCQNLKCDIRIINILPIASYPQYYKNAFIKKTKFSTKYNLNNVSVGFCNIKFIRKYSQFINAYIELEKWLKSSKRKKIVFVYTVSIPFLSALERLKNKYDVEVCVIIADLPNMSNLSNKKNISRKISSKIFANKSYSLLSCVDYYVLLTKFMVDYLKIKKPYCVVEGIATASNEFSTVNYSNDIKKIFYAGTLHEKFGIFNLLEAFRLIDDPSYRLIICGVGDSEQKIKDMAQKDCRITYLGQLPRNEVLKLQAQATVLINPRQNNEEFTKYSFPSKNLEYLSSGVPFLAYKLDGIPDEYDNYILYIEDNEIETLKNKIVEVCSMEEHKRKYIAEKARVFVNEKKNEICQTAKILNLINKNETL